MKIFHTYPMIIKWDSFTVTQDLMAIKTISCYQPQLLNFRDRKIFDFPVLNWCMNFYFSLTLIVLFISSDTFHLVILFSYFIYYTFTFPFLVAKYQLEHCWMYFVLDFRSFYRSFCRIKNHLPVFVFAFLFLYYCFLRKSTHLYVKIFMKTTLNSETLFLIQYLASHI